MEMYEAGKKDQKKIYCTVTLSWDLLQIKLLNHFSVYQVLKTLISCGFLLNLVLSLSNVKLRLHSNFVEYMKVGAKYCISYKNVGCI